MSEENTCPKTAGCAASDCNKEQDTVTCADGSTCSAEEQAACEAKANEAEQDATDTAAAEYAETITSEEEAATE